MALVDEIKNIVEAIWPSEVLNKTNQALTNIGDLNALTTEDINNTKYQNFYLPTLLIILKKKDLLEQIINKIDKPSQGLLLLDWAAAIGDADILKVLLQNNTYKDDEERSETLLCVMERAIQFNKANIVELLLGKGVDVNVSIESTDKNNYTLLHKSIESESLDVVKLLLKKRQE